MLSILNPQRNFHDEMELENFLEELEFSTDGDHDL
jgi:hypothetical protein